MKKISCIIPTSGLENNLALLKNNVETLVKSAKGKVTLVICIVSSNPKVRSKIIDLPIQNIYVVSESLGFAQMNNIAVEKSIHKYKSDYYLLINDDAWVQPNFFQIFLEKVAYTNLDIINPLIYVGKTNVIDSFGVEYFTSGYAKNANSIDYPTALATAGCMLVKTAFLKKMKQKYGFIFNPLLYFYLEDVEFSIRARAIGGNIGRCSDMVAHHIGSATSGKKSRFVMYQTYRNILWTILITWPTSFVVKNFGSVVLVHGWTLLYGTYRFGPLFYLQIYWDTLKNILKIYQMRKQTLKCYTHTKSFTNIYSNYSFRTYHGKTIPS